MKAQEEEEEEEENATGTLDSIRTEGSLEEPRYAKVASSSISQMFQTFLGQLKSNPPCQHVSALNSSECPNKRWLDSANQIIKILPNSGDPQAKERIKLDAKADKKKTRGDSITKASFPFQLLCL